MALGRQPARGWSGGPWRDSKTPGLGSQDGTAKPVYCMSGPLLRSQSGGGGWLLLLAGHGTELVGVWDHQEGKDTVVAGAGLPLRHGKAEALEQTGEEEEELHAGQGLPEACAAACGRVWGCSVSLGPGLHPPGLPWEGVSELGTPGTCREGHEGLLLDKLALAIQEVLGVEAEGLLPDCLVLQH